MAVGDIYALRCFIRSDDVLTSINLGFKEIISGASAFPASVLSAAWDVAILDLLLECLSDQAEIDSIDCRRIAPTPHAPSLLVYVEGANKGEIVDQVLPSNISAAIRFKTDSGNSRNNGGCSIPGIPETMVNGNDLDATYRDGVLTDLADRLILPMEDGGFSWEPAVISRFAGGVKITPPTSHKIIAREVKGEIAGNRVRTARVRNLGG